MWGESSPQRDGACMLRKGTSAGDAGERSQGQEEGRGLPPDVLALLPAVILLLDPAGVVLSASRNIAGLSAEELAGRRLTDIFPDAGEQVVNALADAARTGRGGFDVEAGDGSWWRLDVTPLSRGGCAVLACETTAQRAECAALAESERTFRTIVEQVEEAIVVAQGGRVVFANPGAERLTGRSSDHLLSAELTEFIHPDDRATVLDRHVRRLAGEQPPQSYDFRILRPDGSARWVMITVSLIELWGRAASLSVLRDITERKRTERALAEAELRYRTLFENAPIAIFQALPEGRFTAVNPEYARIVGYASPGEMCADITDIARQLYVDPVEREEYKRQLEMHGAVSNFEVQLLRRDGTPFWASMNSRAIRDESGRLVSIDGFLSDVTERKNAEEALLTAHEGLEAQVAIRTLELRQANEKLREQDGQKSTFVSNASHELRTPLTSVLGFAKMVQRIFQRHFLAKAEGDPLLEEKAGLILENLSIIEQEGRRLTDLLNDLLDINKIEEGRLEWRDAPVHPAALLKDAARRAMPRFLGLPGVSLDVRVAPELPRLMVDADRMHQVLFNLLDNAAKFTGPGEVVLSAIGEAGGWVEIRVADRGPGIRDDEREHVFEKFYQTRTTDCGGVKPKGTGLGLAICRQIVVHYGGSLHVENGPDGVGACFVMRLPGEHARPAS